MYGQMTKGLKHFFRKRGMLDPVYQAYQEGEAFAMYGKSMPPRLQRNPYPPGRRHDEWERGAATDLNQNV